MSNMNFSAFPFFDLKKDIPCWSDCDSSMYSALSLSKAHVSLKALTSSTWMLPKWLCFRLRVTRLPLLRRRSSSTPTFPTLRSRGRSPALVCLSTPRGETPVRKFLPSQGLSWCQELLYPEITGEESPLRREYWYSNKSLLWLPAGRVFLFYSWFLHRGLLRRVNVIATPLYP